MSKKSAKAAEAKTTEAVGDLLGRLLEDEVINALIDSLSTVFSTGFDLILKNSLTNSLTTSKPNYVDTIIIVTDVASRTCDAL